MDRNDLVGLWLGQAAGLRAIGEDLAAEYSELHAVQLRALVREEQWGEKKLLTVTEAAARSGLSPGYLRHLLGSGALANAGRPSHPRIRVEDVPRRKRRRGRPREVASLHDPAAGVLSLFQALREEETGN